MAVEIAGDEVTFTQMVSAYKRCTIKLEVCSLPHLFSQWEYRRVLPGLKMNKLI
jgi:hypothetical protein